jgi:hypothetical protein
MIAVNAEVGYRPARGVELFEAPLHDGEVVAGE